MKEHADLSQIIADGIVKGYNQIQRQKHEAELRQQLIDLQARCEHRPEWINDDQTCNNCSAKINFTICALQHYSNSNQAIQIKLAEQSLNTPKERFPDEQIDNEQDSQLDK